MFNNILSAAARLFCLHSDRINILHASFQFIKTELIYYGIMKYITHKLTSFEKEFT